MRAALSQLAKGWRRIVTEHPRAGCPICGQRNCWEQAYARERLIAEGLSVPPAPEDDRPQQATGEARRTA